MDIPFVRLEWRRCDNARRNGRRHCIGGFQFSSWHQLLMANIFATARFNNHLYDTLMFGVWNVDDDILRISIDIDYTFTNVLEMSDIFSRFTS